ncbi:hypothetical protein [Rubellicoccus peritrichatus]|uniref:Uncharacterized protein n=1 Tax=Rubellicoccus peritrichatus TaxID=3080537 RepID=A0AAQ3QWJ3_9BACT|nr:hypothetical protein [Puniceicoccus sp. CR14]WOO41925.1 hypothetical protein RZN69_02410 [Puniceicoccus sp. CR14]
MMKFLWIITIGICLSLFSYANAQDSAPEVTSETAESQVVATATDEMAKGGEAASEEETAGTEQAETEEAAEEPPNPYQALLDNSPFMSKAFKARMAESNKRSAKGFSFQGYAKTDGEWLVCVFHSKDKFARWIKVGDEIHGYKIAELDPKAPSITISGHGTQLILQLENPK